MKNRFSYWLGRLMESYVFMGSLILIEWGGMINAAGAGNEVPAGVFGACCGYWGYLLVHKYRKEKRHEHRFSSTDDLHRTDLGPPYLTTAGDLSHWSAILSQHTGGTYASCSCPHCSSEGAPGNGEGSGLVPDSATPVVGYRCWNFTSGQGLSALALPYQWGIGVNTASCHLGYQRRAHHVGDRGCTCGFYAYKRPDLTDSLPWRISGQIEMFGVVTEHTLGYRASHARITGIFNTSRESRKVAQMYEVKLLPLPKQSVIGRLLHKELDA